MNLAARKRYTPEFKAQAVDLLSTGKPVAQVAEELCISSNLLYNWRHNSQASAPQRTNCAPCAAKTPSCARRMTF
jgi:transposase-like protein